MSTVAESQKEIADKVAAAILDKYDVGVGSRFLDGPVEFYYAEQEDLAAVVLSILCAKE